MRISAWVICLFLFASAGKAAAAIEDYEDTIVPVERSDSASESPGPMGRFVNRLGLVWDSPTWDLYIPAYTWHNRLMYDKKDTDRYNENPWGLGLGRSMFDEEGDWHTLYAIGFMDSYNKFEPMVGYGFLKYWYIGDDTGRNSDSDALRLGLGYTVGLTARENYDYIPLPLALPMVGLEYKKVGIQAVYIPGTYGNGNVLFTWVHWELP